MAEHTGFEPVVFAVTGRRGRPDSSNAPRYVGELDTVATRFVFETQPVPPLGLRICSSGARIYGQRLLVIGLSILPAQDHLSHSKVETDGLRTHNPRYAKPVLSQLSYSPMVLKRSFRFITGFTLESWVT